MAQKRPEKPRDPYAVECGARLRAARLALGYESARKFAELSGVSEDTLSSYERGVNRVDEAYVRRLKRLFGITFEWIYDGDGQLLPRRLLAPLAHYAAVSSSSTLLGATAAVLPTKQASPRRRKSS